MARHWAFVGLTVLSALAVVRCGSSNVIPPIAGQGDADGGVYKPPTTPDTGPKIDTSTSGGPASAMSLSPSTVNFGAVNCGATAAPQTVQIINNSGAAVSLAFYFEESGGQFSATFKDPVSNQNLGNSVATFAPLAAMSLVVTPIAVPTAPKTADIANGYKDTIQLVVNGGSNTANAIPVQEGAQGVIFSFDTTTLSFGQVPVNSTSVAQTVRVTNNGSEQANFQLTATVTSDAGTDPFSVTEPTDPLPSGQTLSLTAAFTPAVAAAETGLITLSLADSTPLCAPLPPGITLSGSGVIATTVVSVGDGGVGGGLTFGPTNCGATATPARVTITNTGTTGSVPWSASFLSGGSFYQLSATSGTVNASSSTTFTVTPNQIPKTSPVTTDYYAATLQVVSGNDDQTTQIPIHQTAQGAIITTTGFGATDFGQLPFGTVSVDQTATVQFTITNSGNMPVTGAQLANAATAFAVNPGAANPQLLTFSIGAQSSIVAAATFTPTSVTTYSDTANYTIANTTILCQDPPPNFTLSGSGNTGISVAPTPLNFGVVPCGGAAPAGQEVTITNQGAATTWQGTFGRGAQTYYQIETLDGGVLAQETNYALPAGETNILVVPNPITPPVSTQQYGLSDLLTIITGATGSNGFLVTINETAQGAYLQFSVPSIAQTGVALGQTNTQTISVTNSGNLPAYYYTTTSLTQGNDTLIPYAPSYAGACQTYTGANPFPNQCAPPGSCSSGGSSYQLVLPEFCTNLTYTASAPGSLYGVIPGNAGAGGQSQNVVVEETGYPQINTPQAQGYLTLNTCTAANPCTGVPNTITCSDPVLTVPLMENAN